MKIHFILGLIRLFLPVAQLAELVDALDLGSSGITRGGSSPSLRTISKLYNIKWQLNQQRQKPHNRDVHSAAEAPIKLQI